MWKVNPISKPKVNLNDIRSEQLALSLDKENHTTDHDADHIDVNNDVNGDDIGGDVDDDLALALALSKEECSSSGSSGSSSSSSSSSSSAKEDTLPNNVNVNNDDNIDEDMKLALALQMIENEEHVIQQDHHHHNNNNNNPINNLRHIHSSQWNQALALENQLNTITNGNYNANNLMFKSGIACMNDGSIITKHNSLLKSLNNTISLSEYDYAGDLIGDRILVNDLGAKSFLSSIQKLNRIDKDRQWNKRKQCKDGHKNKVNSSSSSGVSDSKENSNGSSSNVNNDNDGSDGGSNVDDNSDDGDDSDDDDYYNRLQDAAPTDNDNDANNDTNNNEMTSTHDHDDDDVTEDTYFDRIDQAIHANHHNDSSILPEDHLVWQSLLRNNCNSDDISSSASLIHIPYDEHFTSSLLLLQQWAFSKLPLSSSIYRCCDISWGIDMYSSSSSSSSDDSIGAGHIYCDHIKHPLFFMIMKKEVDHHHHDGGNDDDGRSITLLHVTLFCGDVIDNDNSMFDVIANKISILGHHNSNSNDDDDKISITFRALDYRLIEPLSISLRKRGFHQSWISLCELYVLHDVTTTTTTTTTTAMLPTNYYYSKLTIDDANIINDTWKYKSKTSLKMIQKMITEDPCHGIRYHNPNSSHSSDSNNDILVSWSLTYDYTAIGMLYTLDDHRKLGLGRLITLKVIDIWIDKRYGLAPFVYITNDNVASKKLFTSIGFQKANDCCWIGYSNFS